MENLASLGIFFAGVGVFLASCGFMWWCSIYQEVKLPKQK